MYYEVVLKANDPKEIDDDATGEMLGKIEDLKKSIEKKNFSDIANDINDLMTISVAWSIMYAMFMNAKKVEPDQPSK